MISDINDKTKKSIKVDNDPMLFFNDQKSLIRDFHQTVKQFTLEESEHSVQTLGRFVDF